MVCFYLLFRTVVYLGMVFGFLAILWAIGFGWFAATVVTMKPQNIDETTDAIIVLTGGDLRINTGLDLLAAGKAKKLFISGVNNQVKTEDLMSLWQGDPSTIECCITLGYKANTTGTNATESADWIRDNHVTSIRLVTSNYHMLRSSLLFRRILPDLVIYDHPVHPEDFALHNETFWRLTFEDYNKLILTWFRLDMLTKNPSLRSSGDLL